MSVCFSNLYFSFISSLASLLPSPLRHWAERVRERWLCLFLLRSLFCSFFFLLSLYWLRALCTCEPYTRFFGEILRPKIIWSFMAIACQCSPLVAAPRRSIPFASQKKMQK